MTTPTGSPAWRKLNDHATYGGHTSKQNYQSQGAVNPLTDVTAEQFCRLASDVAALQRVAEFCLLTYTCNDAAPAAPTINEYDAMVSTVPTGTRNGNGDVTFRWLATYNDDYGVAGAFNIAHCLAAVVGSTACSVSYELIDADVDGLYESVRVRALTAAGAGLSDAKITLTVYTG